MEGVVYTLSGVHAGEECDHMMEPQQEQIIDLRLLYLPVTEWRQVLWQPSWPAAWYGQYTPVMLALPYMSQGGMREYFGAGITRHSIDNPVSS